MDYDNIAEEYVNEVNFCHYKQRRRTVSETEPQNLLPPELFRRSDDRKSRISQSTSPSRGATSNNGCSSPGDTSVNPECECRSRSGSKKMGEWHGGGQHRRRFVVEDHDVEMAEPLTADSEFRRRAGSHGIRDLLRIRPRCYSHGEKADSPAVTPARGGGGNSGNVTPLSPGTATSSASSSASSSVSRFKVFLDAFRHRANSDSYSNTQMPLRDDDGKRTMAYSADESDMSSGTLGRQDSGQSAAVGPAEFLELYRTRTVSDPRSDQRLDALSRVRMRKLYRNMMGTGTSGRRQLIIWKDRLNGTRLIELPKSGDACSLSPYAMPAACRTRVNCRQLLESVTCYDVMPRKTCVVVIDSELPVKKAFYALLDNGIRAALVWDTNHQSVVGLFTVTDFIRILCHYYRTSKHELSGIGDQTITRWREVLYSSRKPMVFVSPDSSLLDAFCALHGNAIHRLLVVDVRRHNPLYTMTHLLLLRYVYAKSLSMGLDDLLLSHTLQDLRELVEQTPVSVVTYDTRIIDVLEMFISLEVSAVPVVDRETSSVVDIFCKSDVINLAVSSTYCDLDTTIGDTLTTVTSQRFETLHTCLWSDSIKSTIDKLVTTQSNQLIVVDESTELVTGVVTQSDVLQYLISLKS